MVTQRIEEHLSLSGQSAIVTGAGTAIGRSVAQALADTGAAVVLVAYSQWEHASETLDMIKAEGGKAYLMRADPNSGGDAEKVAQTAMDLFGRCDILVNTTPAWPAAFEATGVLWQKALRTQLEGLSLYSRAVARKMMVTGRGGRVINIAPEQVSSTSGLVARTRPRDNVAVVSRLLADEFATFGIQVNAVATSLPQTPQRQMEAVGLYKTDGRMGVWPSNMAGEQWSQGSQSSEEDVATVVLFLLSPAAKEISGQLVVVDGSVQAS